MNINKLLFVWVGSAVNGQPLAHRRSPHEMLRHSSGGVQLAPSKQKVDNREIGVVGGKVADGLIDRQLSEELFGEGSLLEATDTNNWVGEYVRAVVGGEVVVRNNRGLGVEGSDADHVGEDDNDIISKNVKEDEGEKNDDAMRNMEKNGDVLMNMNAEDNANTGSALEKENKVDVADIKKPYHQLQSSALETTFDRRALGESCSTPFSFATQIGQDIDGEFIGKGDYYHQSVSLSADGKVVAIGSPYNDGGGDNSGHVRIFTFDGWSKWIQIGQDIDGEAAGDYSGYSVSLSANGKVVAIGSRYNGGGGYNSGHVRVFAFDGWSTWIQIGQDIDGEAVGGLSGTSVSLSADGKAVAIGGSSGYGHVRVFKFDYSSKWIQIGQDIRGEAVSDMSGRSVSLSADGKVVAIGATRNDGGGLDSGHVRVFKFDERSNWVQIGQDIDGEAAGDESGWSVSLSADGKVVATGALYNDGGGYNSGHVRIFKFDDSSNWIQIGQDIDGEAAFDESGCSVSLSADGKVVAIGAQYNDGGGSLSGHVRIFKFDDLSNWIQIGQDIDGEAESDISGRSVSLSADGKVVAIGARYSDGENWDKYGGGRVRLFSLNVVDVEMNGGEVLFCPPMNAVLNGVHHISSNADNIKLWGNTLVQLKCSAEVLKL